MHFPRRLFVATIFVELKLPSLLGLELRHLRHVTDDRVLDHSRWPVARQSASHYTGSSNQVECRAVSDRST